MPSDSAGSDKKLLAYEMIKNKIIVGELPPLMDISEDELQKELDISRTPIREALQRLQKEGFVYIYPRKGTIVSEVTEDLIREISNMRMLNEAFIVKQACLHIPEDWLREKRREFVEPPAGLQGEELREYFMNVDQELHMGFLSYCNNRFLQSIMSVVYDHNHRIRLYVSNPNLYGDNSIQEHINIIDATLLRDADTIDRAVRTHAESSHTISVRFFRKTPATAMR